MKLWKMRFTFGGIGKMFAIMLIGVASQAMAQEDAANRVRQLENRLQDIQNEINRIRIESARTTQKVEEFQQSAPTLEEICAGCSKRTMLFFRGGYARSDEHRNGTTLESRVAPVGAQEQADRHAWYVGAGFDFQLTRNAWGFIPKPKWMPN